MSSRSAGYDVVLNDVKKATRRQGARPRSSATWTARSRKGSIKEGDISRRWSASARAELAAFADCDLVIEAATEDEAVKRKIFDELCPQLKPDAMLATNTSSISITRLAAATDRPERFIGMHFMNPVPVMKLVELIRGIATDDDTFAAAAALRREARQDHGGVARISRPSSSTAS